MFNGLGNTSPKNALKNTMSSASLNYSSYSVLPSHSFFFLTGLLTFIFFSTSSAQDPQISPGGIYKHEENTWRELLREQEEAPSSPEIETPTQESPSKKNAPDQHQKTFKVKRFEVSSSELLTDKEIASIIKPNENKDLSTSEIKQVVDDFNELYAKKGHPTARAFLGSKKIRNGIVKIRLVEAKVGKLQIKGREDISADFIRKRVDHHKGETLSVPKLEEDLIRFNRLTEANVRAKLAPGASFGTTDIVLDIIEPKPYQLSLFADNAGRKTVGRFRQGAYFKAPNILGRNDPLSIIADRSRGSHSYSLSYSVPLNAQGLRLETSWSDSEIEVVESPYEHLDITGDFSELTIGLLYPFFVNTKAHWSAYTRFSRSWSESYSQGIKQQDLTLDIYTVGVTGSIYDNNGRWHTEQSLHLATEEKDVFYYSGSLTRWQRLTDRFTMLMSCAAQYAPAERALPSSEQFQVGGSNTVRGFSEGALGGKSGYYVNLELRHPLWRTSDGMLSDKAGDSLEGFAFIDHGAAFPFRGDNGNTHHEDFISSAGLGTRLNISNRITGRLAFGFYLDKNERDPDPEFPWIHFAVQARCF